MIQKFQRDITQKISLNEDNCIVLTAVLKDIVHDIFVEFTVEPEHLEIINVMVEFNQSPTIYCCKIEEKMKGFIGVKIEPGLTKAILKILGGKEGCGNLLTLVMGLLPLAVNAKAAAGLETNDEIMEAIKGKLTGTCVGYPEID